jgi:hypothetical protein
MINNYEGKYMEILDEAREIMDEAGCKNAYAIYKLKINEIIDVKEFNKNYGNIELKRTINQLNPAIVRILELDIEKEIECPLNSSPDKYLEFSLENRSIKTHNLRDNEIDDLKKRINYLLEEYQWELKER